MDDSVKITRIRVKRVNAGRLNMRNSLQGWTSMATWGGETVLQAFDLFTEEYGAVRTPAGSHRSVESEVVV